MLASKGQGAMGNDQDDIGAAAAAHGAAARHRQPARRHAAGVDARRQRQRRALKASLTQLLRERRKLADADEDNFNVLDTRQIADTLSGTTQVMTTLLGAVAAVSLLVGGIGIMNIMLVSVTERTREIGLRLAIGALEREVLLQFLIEAVVLAALGGVIGIVLATVASIVLAQVMQVPYLFNPGDQPAVVRVLGRRSAWCSATFRPAARRGSTRSRRCGTNRPVPVCWLQAGLKNAGV